MADLKAFAEQLVNLTVKEVNELATILKEEYGIEPAAAAVAVAAGPAAGSLCPVFPYSQSVPALRKSTELSLCDRRQYLPGFLPQTGRNIGRRTT